MSTRLLSLALWLCAIVLGQSSIPSSVTVDGGVNPCSLLATGTDSYQCSMPRQLGSYQDGACYVTTVDVDNTGSATLSIDGLVAKTIIRQDGSALENSDLRAGRTYMICYSSGNDNLQLIGVSAPVAAGGGSGIPGGSGGQLQYNSGGVFAGVAGTSVAGSRIMHSGKIDLSGASAGLLAPRGPTLPATCEIGESWFKTNEVAGRNWYDCVATNTWIQRSGAAAGGSGAAACKPGPGVNIPDASAAVCSAATATGQWAWGGIDFPDPAGANENCIILHRKTPYVWNGSSYVAPTGLRLRMSFARVDGTSAGNLVMTAKTRWVPEGGVLTTAEWNAAATNDSTSGARPINAMYITAIQTLNMTGVAAGRMLEIALCRATSDTTPATIRAIDFELGWNPTLGSGAAHADFIPAVSIGGSLGVIPGEENAQLYDDAFELTTTQGAECRAGAGVHVAATGGPTCVVRSATPPDAASALQFPDGSTTCAVLNRRAPPNWDTVTPPSLLLTWVQSGSGAGNMDLTASTWSITQGATYGSPSFNASTCDGSAAPGDGKVATAICPALAIDNVAPGRGYKLRICRTGGTDALNVPIQAIDGAVRWTVTRACAAP